MTISKTKIFIKVIIFAIISSLIFFMLEFLLVPSTIYTRVMMHELYNQKEPIDIAFIGASRIYRGINPQVFDEKLNVNSFNASSSAQVVVDSYYILKEMYKKHSPKIVLIDITWSRLFTKEHTTQSEKVFNYYKFSQNKFLYLRDAFDSDRYIKAFIPALQYANAYSMIAPKTMLKNAKGKLNMDYFTYDYASVKYDDEWYVGKGFVYSEKSLKEKNFGKVASSDEVRIEKQIWDSERVGEKNIEFFEKIIRLCKENDSIPILIGMPSPMPFMGAFNNYSDYSAFIEDLISKNNVDYFDFNMIKRNVFERKDNYFNDSVHLSGEGGQLFSHVLSEFVSKYLDGSLKMDDYFYPSYDELMKNSSYVFNVWLEEEGNTNTYKAFTYAGSNVVTEFEFLYKSINDEEFTILRPYSEDATIETNEFKNGSYIIRVNARSKDSDDHFQQYYEMKYSKK